MVRVSRALAIQVRKRFASGFNLDVSLRASLPAGSILVLFGPSGSGKTTIVRSVAGLERPDSGAIEFGDSRWFDAASRIDVAPQERRVGYVFQDSALFPHLSVIENVAYGVRAPASRRLQRAEEWLRTLEIAELADRRTSQLSGGQTQRVALARALAADPQLLLLDEPFASLDVPTRGRLRSVLRESIRAAGIPAVLVTHDRHEAIALGDQLAVVVTGLVRQLGPVLDVFRRPADLSVARSVGVESVMPARIDRVDDGLVELRVGAAVLRAADVDRAADDREVFVCIRAEDVTLERSAPVQASARNHLPGRIVAIESEGPIERVTVDCGFPLAALITRHAREEMSLVEGAPVVAAIKATAVHLVLKS
jgi:molybdate transport system ATP-binding protein